MIAMPVQYEDKKLKIVVEDTPEGANVPTEDGKDRINGWTNELTRDFQKNGYVVLRNFIPKEIIDMTLDAWLSIENKPEWNDAFFAVEDDIIHDSPKQSLRKSQGCYSFPPSVSLHRWLRDNLDKVIDMQLVETYAYTRKYERGAFLKAHSDRPSCEVSATICLKYKTDDNTPWKIWVQKDKNYINDARGDGQQRFFEEMQDIPHRDRKGTPISLEVGDLLLYQGPNAVHWRDTLLGDHSYHMFLHFINHGGQINAFDKFHQPKKTKRADGRPHSVFAYDGRMDRYSHKQQEYFHTAMKFWNEWSGGAYDWFDPSQFINNYDIIEDVELTDREKRLIKNDGI
tara:strand:+ start:2407 stop:3432 length:1026 start_codon:yes stop_codon:yes gene_type:complete